ncbi:MAG: FHA domain-containing protein [bacterium]|nr:FHA domain-containing protein [bacterium]
MQAPYPKQQNKRFLMNKSGSKKPTPTATPHGDELPLRLVLHIQNPTGGAPKILATRMRDKLIVGRTSVDTPVPVDIDLALFDAVNTGVSRQHAAFYFADGTLEVEDLQSTNGTRINGFPVQSGRRYRLRNGDELEFGRLQMVIKIIRAAG